MSEVVSLDIETARKAMALGDARIRVGTETGAGRSHFGRRLNSKIRGGTMSLERSVTATFRSLTSSSGETFYSFTLVSEQ